MAIKRWERKKERGEKKRENEEKERRREVTSQLRRETETQFTLHHDRIVYVNSIEYVKSIWQAGMHLHLDPSKALICTPAFFFFLSFLFFLRP